MFRREDLKFLTHSNTSAKGLQIVLNQAAELYKEGWRIAEDAELSNYDKAKLFPWRIAMVKVGTKSIEELERETPEYILAQFNEIPDNANTEALDAFCTTYNVEVKEADKRPITRYRKVIKEQLTSAIKSKAEEAPEQPEQLDTEVQDIPTE